MVLLENIMAKQSKVGVNNRSHLRDRCRHGYELAHTGVRAIELHRVVCREIK
jgi:hypothetical protein